MSVTKFSWILSNMKQTFFWSNFYKYSALKIIYNMDSMVNVGLRNLFASFSIPVPLPYFVPVDEINSSSNCLPPLDDGILWAAPKCRRPLEKRRTRKFGNFKGVNTRLLKVKALHSCLACGGPHEIGRLCPNCYSKIKDVTAKIQQAMKKYSRLEPVENDFISTYKGEKFGSEDGYVKGKCILEVDIERPSIFSKNLRMKSNVGESSEVGVSVTDSIQAK